MPANHAYKYSFISTNVNKKFFFIILFGVVTGFSVYAYLGGFNTPKVIITTSVTQYVAGTHYAGPANNEELGQLFRQAAENLEKKKLSGVLANIYYNNPGSQTDSLEAFIGILVKDTTQVPAGYQIKKVPGGRQVVQATIQAHYSISPNKLYPALFEFIKNQQINTQKTYLEIFYNPRTALVQTEIIP